MQNRTEHWNGIKTLKVAMAVPVHHCHGIAGFYSELGQDIGQTADAPSEVAIGETEFVPIYDLLLGILCHRGEEQVFDQVVDLYCQQKFIEPLARGKENKATDKNFIINESRRLNLDYYKNNCIAFFIPAAYTAMSILEKDTFRFSAAELHTGFEFWQDFFKYEFALDVENRPEFSVRKSIKAFIDNAVVVPHKTLPDTYDITPAALRKLNLFSLFLKTYFESYWIVLSYYKRNPQNSAKPKDRLNKIAARGNRMYKRKEIDRKEALSKVSYQNAVEFFTSKGIKGSDDTKKIEVYAQAIQKALKHLRP